jgi:hypothetical protein
VAQRLVAVGLDEPTAAALNGRYRGTFVEVVVGDASELRYPDGIFDSVGSASPCSTTCRRPRSRTPFWPPPSRSSARDHPTRLGTPDLMCGTTTDVKQREDLQDTLEHRPEDTEPASSIRACELG